MTKEKNPADYLIDALVYLPAGIALTLVEEVPKLTDKGRHRISGQVHTARIVGQIALQMGRAELSKRFFTKPVSQPGSGPVDPASREPEPPRGDSSGSSAPPHAARAASVSQSPRKHAEDHEAEGSAREGSVDQCSGNKGETPPSPDAQALGIPGYDSLSASQVVQRLGGLSAGELLAVRHHELANRGRRTILNRVEQLLELSGNGAAG